jgi:tetratricopeptide (TPR) repeat protein
MILLDYWPLRRFPSKVDVIPTVFRTKKKKKIPETVLKKNLLTSDEKKLPERKIASLLWEKTPFLSLSALLSVVTLYVPHNHEALTKECSLLSRLANAPVAFVTYIIKTFWPYGLAVFYPFPEQISLWETSLAAIFIIVLSTAVIVKIKRMPYLCVGWLWYAITILPVIGIIQISLNAPYAMADRYHYLSSIGIAVMMTWGFSSLIRYENSLKKILFPAGIIYVILLALITWQQCGYWKTRIDLWEHTLMVTENNFLAHNNLGIALSADGRIEEAVYQYNEVIRIIPKYPLAYFNRGNAYYKMGHYRSAIDDYNRAISLKPDYAKAYSNRAALYLNQGNAGLGCCDAQKACNLGNCSILENAKANGDCR